MTFSEALEELKKGNKIYRTSWINNYYNHLNNGNPCHKYLFLYDRYNDEKTLKYEKSSIYRFMDKVGLTPEDFRRGYLQMSESENYPGADVFASYGIKIDGHDILEDDWQIMEK